MKKLTVFCLAIAFTLTATAVFADQTFVCTYGPDERVISVVYLNQDAKIPCEVQYTKDGTTETLWNALNEVGYCEEKAQAFVEKQQEWGWTCEEAAAVKDEQ